MLKRSFKFAKYINGFFQTTFFLNERNLNDLYRKNLKLELSYKLVNIRSTSLSTNSFNLPSYLEDKKLAIHIRGLDYLNTHENIGLLSHQYYLKALSLFDLQNIELVVLFTDDKVWATKIWRDIEGCDKKYRHLNVYFLDSNIRDLEAFFYLSTFKNVIISNSTFSWWATYFRRNEKFVVAPTNWYRSGNYCKSLLRNDFKSVDSQWEN